MADIKCVLCALGVPLDPEDAWVGMALGPYSTDPNRPNDIFIVNGQSVCGRHIEAPYAYPTHGLGGMQARLRRDREEDALRERGVREGPGPRPL